MKKYLWTLLLGFCVPVIQAEQLTLITLLSQPIGSFATVNLLDSATPSNIFHLNFSNNLVNSANITLSAPTSGSYSFHADELLINSSTKLGGSVPLYRLTNSMNLAPGAGSFNGGNLRATSISLTDDYKILISSDINSTDATGTAIFNTPSAGFKSHVGSFNTMTITDKAKFDTLASGNTYSTSLAWTPLECAADSTDDSQACAANLLTGPVACTKICRIGQTLNPVTCECQSISLDPVCSIKICDSGYTFNSITCKCEPRLVIADPVVPVECTKTCDPTHGSFLNEATCTCYCDCSQVTLCGCKRDSVDEFQQFQNPG